MKEITTIAFDYGGVIAKRIDETYLCHMASVAGVRQDRFSAALWRHRNEYDAAHLNAHEYWRTVLEECGAESSGERRAREETIELLMHLDSYAWATINPAILRWIATLRREGYRRVLISNMSPETYDMIIRDSMWISYFDRAIISGRLQVNKPDRKIFIEAARQMEVEPGEMLFLDDLEHNVEGARAAGLHALQFIDAAGLAGALEEHYPLIPRYGLEC